MESATDSAVATNPAADFEVPGEPGVYWCARHRKVKTRLRCGRCERPICPKCTKFGPTGARCPDCASNRGSHIYQVSPLNLLTTFAATAVLGAVGAVVVRSVGLLVLFYAAIVGPLLGRVVTSITRGKRGPKIAVTASAGIIVGTLASAGAIPLILALVLPHRPGTGLPESFTLVAAFADPFLWIYIALAVSGVWWWLK